MTRLILKGVILAGLLSPQWGMGPGPGMPHAAGHNACLVSGWPMNEGSGRVFSDVSGNANNVSAVSATPTWGSNAGFPGSSLTMPSGNGTATSTTLTNFTGTTAFSLAAWISITSSTNQIILSTLSNAGTYTGWEIGTNNLVGGTNSLQFGLMNNLGGNAIVVYGSTNIVSTGKHYVVATYDGSRSATTGVKLYVDGTLETMTVNKNNLSLTAANGQVAGMGQRPADLNAMSGVEAAVSIYNCVLTPTQVTTYNALGPQVN